MHIMHEWPCGSAGEFHYFYVADNSVKLEKETLNYVPSSPPQQAPGFNEFPDLWFKFRTVIKFRPIRAAPELTTRILWFLRLWGRLFCRAVSGTALITLEKVKSLFVGHVSEKKMHGSKKCNRYYCTFPQKCLLTGNWQAPGKHLKSCYHILLIDRVAGN